MSEIKRPDDGSPRATMQSDDLWVRTYTGRRFNVANPDPSEFDIRDIARGLSLECRFGRQCQKFYSVAEHCLMISLHLPDRYALWGLLHDAAEAYLGDLPTPIKQLRALRGYRELEELYLFRISAAFGLTWPVPAIVKEYDRRAYVTERTHLFPDWILTLDDEGPELSQCEPLQASLKFMRSDEAEKAYLDRYAELTSGSFHYVSGPDLAAGS